MMKILPYPDNPIFLCYHNKAYPFGIIQANANSQITKWLCTKCVNTVFVPNSALNKFDLSVGDPWGSREGITTQQVFNMKKELLPFINIDLLSMFRTLIDNGCYVHGTYNERYIPFKKAYGVEDYIHDYLVIGYNNTCFYSVGFVADGHFRRFEIPFQNFIDGLNYTGSSKINVNFFNYNEGAVLKPNVDRMLSDLDKYISTANYLDNPTPTATSYGISTLYRVKEFFLDEVINNDRIYVDKRYSRVLYEHEWILSQIISLFLDENEQLYFAYCTERNLNRAQLIHTLGLKIEHTGDATIIYRIARYIDEIVEEEKNYIPKLISLLKSKRENGKLL